jgi:hypothetical protein
MRRGSASRENGAADHSTASPRGEPRMSTPTVPPNLLNNIRRGELKRLLLRRAESKIEVHNLVEDILAERDRWTAGALGRRMDLTFHEKIRFGIRTIACIDRS